VGGGESVGIAKGTNEAQKIRVFLAMTPVMPPPAQAAQSSETSHPPANGVAFAGSAARKSYPSRLVLLVSPPGGRVAGNTAGKTDRIYLAVQGMGGVIG